MVRSATAWRNSSFYLSSCSSSADSPLPNKDLSPPAKNRSRHWYNMEGVIPSRRQIAVAGVALLSSSMTSAIFRCAVHRRRLPVWADSSPCASPPALLRRSSAGSDVPWYAFFSIESPPLSFRPRSITLAKCLSQLGIIIKRPHYLKKMPERNKPEIKIFQLTNKFIFQFMIFLGFFKKFNKFLV